MAGLERKTATTASEVKCQRCGHVYRTLERLFPCPKCGWITRLAGPDERGAALTMTMVVPQARWTKT